jgi:hypothetical protein
MGSLLKYLVHAKSLDGVMLNAFACLSLVSKFSACFCSNLSPLVFAGWKCNMNLLK